MATDFSSYGSLSRPETLAVNEYLRQIMRNKRKGKNMLATDLGILLNLSTPPTQDLGVEVAMLFRVDYIVTTDFDRLVVGECLMKEPALTGLDVTVSGTP